MAAGQAYSSTLEFTAVFPHIPLGLDTLGALGPS